MVLAACDGINSASAPLSSSPTDAPQSAIKDDTGLPESLSSLPTLYPTATVPPTRAATLTAPVPTATPEPTQVPLDTAVVALRYEIPALGLSRRLEGTMGSQVVLVDETTGITNTLTNQAGVMIELQQAFSNLSLPPVPDDCQRCVRVEFALPLLNQAGAGHLTDPVLLASLENYMALALGPHFPPGTAIGLRRSASPYDVAQTVALTEDGLAHRWLATQAEVPEPVPAQETLATIRESLVGVSLPRRGYVADCPGVSIETLMVSGQDETVVLPVVCPDLVLPSGLVPAYLALDALLATVNADSAVGRPVHALGLQDVLYYRRADGASLALAASGRMILVGLTAEPVLQTMTTTTPVSLTLTLSATGALIPGADALITTGDPLLPGDEPVFDTANVLGLRLADGVYSIGWEGAAPAALVEPLALLDERLDALLAPTESPAPPVVGATPTP
jgi:hypothetical protein